MTNEKLGIEHAPCYYDTDRNKPLSVHSTSEADTLRTIIATKDGEIGALTAEVTHLAEKLAERAASMAPTARLQAAAFALHDAVNQHVAADDRTSLGAAFEEMDNAMAAALDAGADRNGELGRMRAVFHVSMMKAHPGKSHAEIARAIDDALGAPQPVDAAHAVPEGREPFAWGHDDFGTAELSRVQRVGWFPLYRTPSPAAQPAAQGWVPFQGRVQPWMTACFGPGISADKVERNHRFYEEATELVQSTGMSRAEAHELVDYTYDRPMGEPKQEVGGVMVTLAALCLAQGLDMHDARRGRAGAHLDEGRANPRQAGRQAEVWAIARCAANRLHEMGGVMRDYPIPSKAVKAAMDAQSTLNIFAAIEAMLEGGVISGDNAAAKKVITICQKEAGRQIGLIDKAVAQANKDAP